MSQGVLGLKAVAGDLAWDAAGTVIPFVPVAGIKGVKYGDKVFDASKNTSKISGQIAEGHSYAKHVQGINNPLGQEFGSLIKTREEYSAYIKSVLDNPSVTRQLKDNRTAYYDKRLGSIVIHNPKIPDAGTAFRPDPSVHGYKTNLEYFNKGLK